MVEMPLQQVLARVAPAYYGNTWPDVVTAMLQDADDAEIVNHLICALRRDGRFEEPVVIEGDQVGNGMHRLVASILAGVETISVSHVWPEPAKEWIELQFRVVFLGQVDNFDVAVNRLRSFPLGSTWVSAGSFSGNNGLISAAWECPHALVGQLQEAVRNRLSDVGGALEVIQYRLLANEWD